MKTIIYGASQYGVFVSYAAKYDAKTEIIGFIDDNKELHGKKLRGIPVLGDASVIPGLIKKGLKGAIIGIGDNYVRASIAAKMKKLGLKLVNVIHPSAVTSEATLGEGIVMMAGAVATYNPKIGNNVYIAPGVIITHDSVIGDNVTLATGCVIGARVHIKDYALIGQNAAVMTGVKSVGKNAIVGAGAAVIRDVPDNAVVVGVPAKVIKYNEPRPCKQSAGV